MYATFCELPGNKFQVRNDDGGADDTVYSDDDDVGVGK